MGACLLCCVQASPRKKRGVCSKAQPLSPAQNTVDPLCREAAAAHSETDIYFSLCSIRHRVERLTPSWTAA